MIHTKQLSTVSSLFILTLFLLAAVTGTQAQEVADEAAGPDAAGKQTENDATAEPAADPGTLPSTGQDESTEDPEDEAQSRLEEFVAKIASAREIGVILLGLSVIGFAFAIERAFCLRRSRICPNGLAEEVANALKREDYEAVDRACEQHPSVLARVLHSVARHHQFGFSEISMIAGDVSSRELRGHM